MDAETGKVVDDDNQVKGYPRSEDDEGDYVMLEDDEIVAVALESTHTIDVETFIDRETRGFHNARIHHRDRVYDSVKSGLESAKTQEADTRSFAHPPELVAEMILGLRPQRLENYGIAPHCCKNFTSRQVG